MPGVSIYFFFSSRRRHTRYWRDWSSDVCSSDLVLHPLPVHLAEHGQVLRVRHLVLGDEPGAEGAEGVAALALVPGAAALDLPLALGHVVADRVAGDVVQRLRFRDAGGAGADDDGELHLPVGFAAVLRDHHIVVRAAEGAERLQE